MILTRYLLTLENRLPIFEVALQVCLSLQLRLASCSREVFRAGSTLAKTPVSFGRK